MISNSHRKPFIHQKQSWRFEIVINEIYNIIDFYSIFKLKSKTKGSIYIGIDFKSLNFVCQFWIISSWHFFNNQMVWFLFPRTFFLIPRGNFFYFPVASLHIISPSLSTQFGRQTKRVNPPTKSDGHFMSIYCLISFTFIDFYGLGIIMKWIY